MVVTWIHMCEYPHPAVIFAPCLLCRRDIHCCGSLGLEILQQKLDSISFLNLTSRCFVLSDNPCPWPGFVCLFIVVLCRSLCSSGYVVNPLHVDSLNFRGKCHCMCIWCRNSEFDVNASVLSREIWRKIVLLQSDQHRTAHSELISSLFPKNTLSLVLYLSALQSLVTATYSALALELGKTLFYSLEERGPQFSSAGRGIQFFFESVYD